MNLLDLLELSLEREGGVRGRGSDKSPRLLVKCG